MKKDKDVFAKIHFRLTKDEYGYPPDDWESLWGIKTGTDRYRIDNIPFFIRGVSLGDVVFAINKDGRRLFDHIEIPSSNSVVRTILFDLKETVDLRRSMEELGCASEASHIEGLLAFDVPESASLDKVLSFLQNGEEKGLWEYEEASMRYGGQEE